MKILITRKTLLKNKPSKAELLSPADFENVAERTIVDISGEKQIDGHREIILLNGDVKYVWVEHSKIVYQRGDILPATINLQVPHHSQLNNKFRPLGTCNITSVAMCLNYYGLSNKLPRDQKQLEDDLFETVEARGWDRHVHEHLKKLLALYGVKDYFDTETSWQDIKISLANGNPVIYSGQFSKSGHIIVIRGYDEDKQTWFVNDPNGEYFSTGYQYTSGENLKYSYKLLRNLSYTGQNTGWAHLMST